MTQTLEEYDDLETQVRKLENVHLHKPVSYPQWQSECSRYDIGLFRLYPRDNSQMENIPLAWDPGGAWSINLAIIWMGMSLWLWVQTSSIRHYGEEVWHWHACR